MDFQCFFYGFFVFYNVCCNGYKSAVFIFYNKLITQAKCCCICSPVLAFCSAYAPACQFVTFCNFQFRHCQEVISVCPCNGFCSCIAFIQFPCCAFRVVDCPVDFQCFFYGFFVFYNVCCNGYKSAVFIFYNKLITQAKCCCICSPVLAFCSAYAPACQFVAVFDFQFRHCSEIIFVCPCNGFCFRCIAAICPCCSFWIINCPVDSQCFFYRNIFINWIPCNIQFILLCTYNCSHTIVGENTIFGQSG